MKKTFLILSLVLILCLSLFACSQTPKTNDGTENSVTGVFLNYNTYTAKVGKTVTLQATSSETSLKWSSSDTAVATVSGGTVTAKAVGTATITVSTSDGTYKDTCAFTVVEDEDAAAKYEVDKNDADILIITAAGEYTLERNYKQIYVDAEDAEVIINLNGYTVENSENSPVFVASCDSIDISATKGTTSYIKDTRSAMTAEEDGQGKGAIYVADGDLTLKGKGTLYVESGYYNGVHGKDDVEIKNLTLYVTAVNHGVKGNDSITVESGNVSIVCGGDGMHTENTDVSSKGNQRGNVTVSGGTVTIDSWGDGISAAYNAVIEEADSATPTSLTINTNKYSAYDGNATSANTSVLYIKMSSAVYAYGNYTYAAYIDGQWYGATYLGTQSMGSMGGMGRMGGGSNYYIYRLTKPASATSFTLYRFSGSNVTNFSTASYNAVSDAKAFNSAYDMVQVAVSGNQIFFGNWSDYTASSNSADVSAKGIKAENEVYVTGGTVSIKAYDDGIHANSDATLENGASPLGNINVLGGKITIFASDDGIHADYTLNISGGEINITGSYEGLEANLIRVSGGETYVIATDDGVNATSGNARTPDITVSGGLLDVTVPTNGDTDGIDSNGTYNQTGGVVIVKGPGSAGGRTMGAAAIDSDGAVKISGGTLIVFGGMERTPSSSVTYTLCSSGTVSAGTHTVSFSSASYATTLTYSAGGCAVYSALGTATLK